MKAFSLIVCLFLVSCSNQQVYESIQANAKNKCTEEPNPSLQKKCEEKLIPYKDYEKSRKEQ
jgi:type III secretory pathway component EscR